MEQVNSSSLPKKSSIGVNFGYKFNTNNNFYRKKNSVDNSYFDDKQKAQKFLNDQSMNSTQNSMPLTHKSKIF